MTDSVLAAWLHVIARDGWADARIDAVAEAVGTTSGAVAASLPDRWAALTAFGIALDTAALAEAGTDRAASVRDRLFGMLMARFDAAQEHRAAVVVLAAAARRDPGLSAFIALRLPPSIARIAAAAGVATGGLTGPLRVQALSTVYLVVARSWLTDTSYDLAPTMRELDSRLATAEGWARRLPYRAAVVTPPLALPAPSAVLQ